MYVCMYVCMYLFMYLCVYVCMYVCIYTGHTQKNGAVLIVNTIKTASFLCVCPVYVSMYV
jgi:hypothetical protein